MSANINLHDLLWNMPAPPEKNPVERVTFALRDGGMSKAQAEELVAELLVATTGMSKEEAERVVTEFVYRDPARFGVTK